MSFEIGVPVRPQAASRLSKHQAWTLYPQDPARRFETPMMLYALGFYASYLAAIAGWVPMWAAGVVGFVCLIRYFDQTHAMMHADIKRERPWHPARALVIVMGPLYLGYRELRESHLLHHREEGSPRDPDLLMMSGKLPTEAFWALLQPELSLVDYIRRFGLSPRLALGLLGRGTLYAALMWLGGWPGFVLYNVTARVGNGVAFLVFAGLVHRPWLWGQVRPPRLPTLLARVWVVLVGWDNLVGTRYHFLHHVFPHIPDRRLPEVSRRLTFD